MLYSENQLFNEEFQKKTNEANRKKIEEWGVGGMDYFTKKSMEGKIKTATAIYVVCMIAAIFFRGAIFAWVFGTIFYLRYKKQVIQAAIDHSNRMRNK